MFNSSSILHVLLETHRIADDPLGDFCVLFSNLFNCVTEHANRFNSCTYSGPTLLRTSLGLGTVF